MKFRNQRNKFGPKIAPIFMMADGDGAGGGGGGEGEGEGEGGDKNFTQSDIDNAVTEAIGGLKTKNNELLGKVNDMGKSLKAWEGLDPEQVRGILDKVQNDEVMKLIADGKTEEAFEKRLEKVNATHQSHIDNITGERDGFKTDLEKAQAQIKDLIIDQQVLTGFTAQKGLESAAPDVVLRAKSAFNIEDGQAIAGVEKGNIITGKDGPMTIPEWIEGLKDSAAHLFPGSIGAGAPGAGPGGQGGNIDEQMNAAAKAGDMDLYKKLRTEKAKTAAG